ncbi:hypothetical protein [Actinoplanes derwentensis]|uniref:hypothetical protein n=1 Tax=Actinoplanes derwentensis TaxID=113562 RepID=UPI0012FDB410|nr:hypothetical protein [Actinoplanes derwentensis]GID87670.1 hypothetical protein Ade03nite_65940 [Actinoplanes derwentensis]
MDIPIDVMALCAGAAKILADRMLGDLWDATRQRFNDLFSKAGQDRIGDRLDRDQAALSSASEDQRLEFSERLAASWTTRLQDLIDDHPGVLSELQLIVEEMKDEDPRIDAPGTTVVNQKASHKGRNIYSGRDTNIGRR